MVEKAKAPVPVAKVVAVDTVPEVTSVAKKVPNVDKMPLASVDTTADFMREALSSPQPPSVHHNLPAPDPVSERDAAMTSNNIRFSTKPAITTKTTTATTTANTTTGQTTAKPEAVNTATLAAQAGEGETVVVPTVQEGLVASPKGRGRFGAALLRAAKSGELDKIVEKMPEEPTPVATAAVRTHLDLNAYPLSLLLTS